MLSRCLRDPALRTLPSVTRVADDAAKCVVLNSPVAARSGRILAGPASFIGSDIERGSVHRRGNGQRYITLALRPSGVAAIGSLLGQNVYEGIVATVDAEIVGQVQFDDVTTASLVHGSDLVLPIERALSRGDAQDLVSRVDDSRAELARQVVAETELTTRGVRLLQEVTLTLDDKEAFAKHCAVSPDQGLVFGCYKSYEVRVLRIDRGDLRDLMSVTLAHELLHHAYVQLTPDKRHEVDELLASRLASLGDERLSTLLDEYERSEPGERGAELHSWLPFIESDMGAQLNRYYNRYFRHRSVLVARYQAFDGPIEQIEGQASSLQAQIADLKLQIDATGAEADRVGAESDSLGAQIDALRAEGRVAESNEVVDAQNEGASRANDLIAQYNALVEQHNALVDQYNQVTEPLRELFESISAVPLAF